MCQYLKISAAFEVTALASLNVVVDHAEKLHGYKDFEQNCKSASGATAAAIGYLQLGKIFREIESLIGDFVMFVLTNAKIFKSLSS